MSLQAEDVLFRFGEFELDGRNLELRRMGSPVTFQPQPARALALLLSRAGETVTREELREHLWGAEHHLDYEQGINFTIRKIRAALDDDPQAPRFLETVPRRGYRFVAEVERVAVERVPPGSRDPAPAPSRRTWARRAGAAAAVVLGALAVLAGALRRPAPEAPADGMRLAVLPFTGASIEPLDAAVSNVVTEELVTRLAARYGRRLGIIAMSSAQVFAGSSAGVDEIGERLDADFLLRGNVSRSDGALRITVRLWRVDDRVHLWAQAFETDIARLPEWYEQVAAEVADALGLGGTSVPGKAPPVPRGPYESYLRGRYLVGRGDEASVLRGIEALQEAVAAAPDLARGHAALAAAYLLLMYTRPASKIAPPAEAAARRAVELDPDLAEGHLALADVLLYFRGDWSAAGRAFRRALDLQPGAAETLHGYGLYLASLGRHDEAIAAIRRAVDLDPATVYISSDLAQVYFWARRYGDAAAQARENLEAEPGHVASRACLVDALSRQGDLGEALHQQNVLFEQLGRPAAATWEEARNQAVDLVATIDEEGRHLGVTLAALLLARGDAEAALARLVTACRERGDWTLPFLAVDPRFDELRSHPRYPELAPCLAPIAGRP